MADFYSSGSPLSPSVLATLGLIGITPPGGNTQPTPPQPAPQPAPPTAAYPGMPSPVYQQQQAPSGQSGAANTSYTDTISSLQQLGGLFGGMAPSAPMPGSPAPSALQQNALSSLQMIANPPLAQAGPQSAAQPTPQSVNPQMLQLVAQPTAPPTAPPTAQPTAFQQPAPSAPPAAPTVASQPIGPLSAPQVMQPARPAATPASTARNAYVNQYTYDSGGNITGVNLTKPQAPARPAVPAPAPYTPAPPPPGWENPYTRRAWDQDMSNFIVNPNTTSDFRVFDPASGSTFFVPQTEAVTFGNKDYGWDPATKRLAVLNNPNAPVQRPSTSNYLRITS